MMKSSHVVFYMIQDKATGLYYKAGLSKIRMNERGKVWRGLGPLKNAISYQLGREGPNRKAFLDSVNIIELRFEHAATNVLRID